MTFRSITQNAVQVNPLRHRQQKLFNSIDDNNNNNKGETETQRFAFVSVRPIVDKNEGLGSYEANEIIPNCAGSKLKQAFDFPVAQQPKQEHKIRFVICF